ncbi:MAG: asparagine--tRNA ligase, partial [Clostridia bacterium]
MELITVKELYRNTGDFDGVCVTVGGWARTIRDSKAFGFIELNDGSFFKSVQIVVDDAVPNFREVVKLNVGSALIVTGKVILTPDAKQPFEIRAEKIDVEGESTQDYPLQKKRHSPEFLRTINYLRPRTNLFSAVFRVRSVAAFAIHKFFNERGFVYAQTPIITGSDCEGAGEMFRITTLDMDKLPLDGGKVDFSKDFFGHETSLTVSGQLEAETFALAYGKTYTFGPTFRAENSNTTRHAAEFWMVEPEIAFADLNDDMALAEAMVKSIISYVLEQCPEEMEFFSNFVDKGLLERLTAIVEADFGVMD